MNAVQFNMATERGLNLKELEGCKHLDIRRTKTKNLTETVFFDSNLKFIDLAASSHAMWACWDRTCIFIARGKSACVCCVRKFLVCQQVR